MSSGLDRDAWGDVVEVFFGEFGRAVTRWPRGESANAASVEVVFEPQATGNRVASREANRLEYRATLWVRSSQTVDIRDAWVIGTHTYQTSEIGDDDEGMRQLIVTRVDRFTTTRAQNRR